MNLNYNILWIDNDIQEYQDVGDVEYIKDYLLDLGFENNLVTISDENQLDNALSHHKYDLIISDFNLDSTTGDKIIIDIREKKNISTEIIFYSTNTDFRDDPQVKEKLAFFDRITFYCGREGLIDKIINLIELTLDKLLELNATRGLITASTSDLDVLMVELTFRLLDLLEKSDHDKNLIIEKYINDFLSKSSGCFQSKFDKIGFDNIFPQIEAFRKWRIFRELLKEFNTNNDDEIKEFLKINKEYFCQVIDIRNKFAHAKAEEVNGNLVLKGQYGKKDFIYSKEACINIRKNLISHKGSFDKLSAILNEN